MTETHSISQTNLPIWIPAHTCCSLSSPPLSPIYFRQWTGCCSFLPPPLLPFYVNEIVSRLTFLSRRRRPWQTIRNCGLITLLSSGLFSLSIDTLQHCIWLMMRKKTLLADVFCLLCNVQFASGNEAVVSFSLCCLFTSMRSCHAWISSVGDDVPVRQSTVAALSLYCLAVSSRSWSPQCGVAFN